MGKGVRNVADALFFAPSGNFGEMRGEALPPHLAGRQKTKPTVSWNLSLQTSSSLFTGVSPGARWSP